MSRFNKIMEAILDTIGYARFKRWQEARQKANVYADELKAATDRLKKRNESG